PGGRGGGRDGGAPGRGGPGRLEATRETGATAGAGCRDETLGAELEGDCRIERAAAFEAFEIDPLDRRVRALAGRAEEHRRDACGGDQRGIRPPRIAGRLRAACM